MPSGQKTDKVGYRNGMLTVVKKHTTYNWIAYWECLCDCGEVIILPTSQISRQKSCGCLKNKTPKEGRFKYVGCNAETRIYHEYKRSAKRRGLEFSLTRNEAVSLLSLPCHYCGRIPSSVSRATRDNGDFNFSGIDRIDNSLGYIRDNCVPCCKVCNTAKSVLSLEEFIDWITLVYNRSVRGKGIDLYENEVP